jgi:hypothetical protein
MQQLPVETEHVRKQTAAKSDRASHDHVKYRLHVRPRGADDAQHLVGGRLPFQSFA